MEDSWKEPAENVRVQDLFTLDDLAQYETETRKKQERRSKKRRRKKEEDDTTPSNKEELKTSSKREVKKVRDVDETKKASQPEKKKIRSRELPKKENKHNQEEVESSYLDRSLEALGSLLHIGRSQFRSRESVKTPPKLKHKTSSQTKEREADHRCKLKDKEELRKKSHRKDLEDETTNIKVKKDLKDGDDADPAKEKRLSKRKIKNDTKDTSDEEENMYRQRERRKSERTLKKKTENEDKEKKHTQQTEKCKAISLESTVKSKESSHLAKEDTRDRENKRKKSKPKEKEEKSHSNKYPKELSSPKVAKTSSKLSDKEIFESDSGFFRTLSKITGLGLLSSLIPGDRKEYDDTKIKKLKETENSGKRNMSRIGSSTRKGQGDSPVARVSKNVLPKNVDVPLKGSDNSFSLSSDQKSKGFEEKRISSGDMDISSNDSTMQIVENFDEDTQISECQNPSSCSLLALKTDLIETSPDSVLDLSKDDDDDDTFIVDNAAIALISQSETSFGTADVVCSSERQTETSSGNLKDDSLDNIGQIMDPKLPESKSASLISSPSVYRVNMEVNPSCGRSTSLTCQNIRNRPCSRIPSVDSDTVLDNIKRFKSEIIEDLNQVKSCLREDLANLKIGLVKQIVSELEEGSKNDLSRASRRCSEIEMDNAVTKTEMHLEGRAGGAGDCGSLTDPSSPLMTETAQRVNNNGSGDGIPTEEKSAEEHIWPETYHLQHPRPSVFRKVRNKISNWKMPKITIIRSNYRSTSTCTPKGGVKEEVEQTFLAERKKLMRSRSLVIHPSIQRQEGMKYRKMFTTYRRNKRKSVATSNDLPGLPKTEFKSKLSPVDLINKGAGPLISHRGETASLRSTDCG